MFKRMNTFFHRQAYLEFFPAVVDTTVYIVYFLFTSICHTEPVLFDDSLLVHWICDVYAIVCVINGICNIGRQSGPRFLSTSVLMENLYAYACIHTNSTSSVFRNEAKSAKFLFIALSFHFTANDLFARKGNELFWCYGIYSYFLISFWVRWNCKPMHCWNNLKRAYLLYNVNICNNVEILEYLLIVHKIKALRRAQVVVTGNRAVNLSLWFSRLCADVFPISNSLNRYLM